MNIKIKTHQTGIMQLFLSRVEPTKLAFIILGASMAGLSIMILVVSSLATGSTRHEVYRTSSGRTYGRVGKYPIRMMYRIFERKNYIKNYS